MAIPSYDRFIDPVLRFLAGHPDGVAARDAHEAAADMLGIGDEDRALLVPSGAQPVYKNRAGWAHDRLKRAGLSSSPKRGIWRLTQKGFDFASTHGFPLPAETIARLATEYMDVRLRTDDADEPISGPIVSSTESPDDRLESALSELRSTVALELLEVLARVSPKYFETIVLDLLHKMGYGASRTDLQRVGGAGDGGIEGIISLDRLGLEKVYVQAKRWQNTVGRPEVQAFYGALAGQRAAKGVFITTSAFSPQALEFAKSVERIVLVDGARLANLMIDHEIGVTLRVLKVPRLDSDYLDE